MALIQGFRFPPVSALTRKLHESRFPEISAALDLKVATERSASGARERATGEGDRASRFFEALRVFVWVIFTFRRRDSSSRRPGVGWRGSRCSILRRTREPTLISASQ